MPDITFRHLRSPLQSEQLCRQCILYATRVCRHTCLCEKPALVLHLRMCLASLQLRLTPDHYVFTATAAATPFAARTAVGARDVKAGDYIWRTAGDAVAAEHVAAVRRSRDTGLVAPFTVRGEISTAIHHLRLKF